jgi:hypothetical protein
MMIQKSFFAIVFGQQALNYFISSYKVVSSQRFILILEYESCLSFHVFSLPIFHCLVLEELVSYSNLQNLIHCQLDGTLFFIPQYLNFINLSNPSVW